MNYNKKYTQKIESKDHNKNMRKFREKRLKIKIWTLIN